MIVKRLHIAQPDIYTRLTYWCWLFIISLFASGCANIVSPTGGPRDTSPPVIIQESPTSGSVNFSENSFTLRFNEFIQTGNLQQQMLISPPVNTPPTIRLKGKSLIISFADTLHADATYAVYLGNTIQDITERNPMVPYTYFFSTGDEIDSYYLKGRLYNARDQKVPDNPLVMLFEHPLADSAAAKELPRYVTRPDKAGHFEFRHLADRPYHLIAVQDMNNNMRYDLITEMIGFISEPLSPFLMIPPAKDTLSDTIISIDTTGFKPEKKTVLTYDIRMFVAEDSIQKVLTARSEGRNKAVVAFRYPMKDPEINLIDGLPDTISFIHTNDRKDTITVWLQKHQIDTIKLSVSDPPLFSDTISIYLRQPAVSSRAVTREIKPSFSMNVPRGGKLNPAVKPLLRFSLPLIGFEKEAAILISPEDTVPLELKETDSLIPLKYMITNTLKSGIDYRVVIPAGSCTGWDGSINDTLSWSFIPDDPENYGTITVVINNDSTSQSPVILMLADEKMTILESRPIVNGVPEKFTFLSPGKYYLQTIMDENNNGKWDTGNYWKGIQPEKVSFLIAPVTVRANWEEEVLWEVRF